MTRKWFRLYAESVDDAKLKLLAFEDRWHFVALLCCKAQGIFESKPELVGRLLRAKTGLSGHEFDEMIARLVDVGLVSEKGEPTNWDKRQFQSDFDATCARRQREFRQRNALRNALVTRLDTDTDTDTDTEKAMEATLPSQIRDANSTVNRRSACPYSKIVDLYHEKLPTLPRIVALTDSRKASMRARWEKDLTTLNDWTAYFEDVSESPFLTGQIEAQPGKVRFQATIDWLLRPANLIKVQEGRYHRRT